MTTKLTLNNWLKNATSKETLTPQELGWQQWQCNPNKLKAKSQQYALWLYYLTRPEFQTKYMLLHNFKREDNYVNRIDFLDQKLRHFCCIYIVKGEYSIYFSYNDFSEPYKKLHTSRDVVAWLNSVDLQALKQQCTKFQNDLYKAQ